jgi:NitT/TauT family transport system ATP-binding protein
MIEINNVGKNYNMNVLTDVSLNIKKGEFVTFIGPSGCGKSTLLKICAGLVEPSVGEVSFDTDNKIGIVFQDHVLLPWRTVRQNVELPKELLGSDVDVMDTIKLVDLTEFADSYPFELSGGMKQRVAIARALVLHPNILMMDEPFGSIDELMRNKLNMDLLRICKRLNPTVLFVTHSISEAVLLSDRVVILSKRPGRVKDVIKIKLARPRSIDMKETQEFQRYVRCIRKEID